MTATALPEPVLSHLGAGDRWLLMLPCEIPMGDGVTMTVPEGVVYDLASIPRGVMWLIGEDDMLSTLAPLAHDMLYRYDGRPPVEWIAPAYRDWTRREADELLYALALRQGCPAWRARLAWAAVRLCARRW